MCWIDATFLIVRWRILKVNCHSFCERMACSTNCTMAYAEGVWKQEWLILVLEFVDNLIVDQMILSFCLTQNVKLWRHNCWRQNGFNAVFHFKVILISSAKSFRRWIKQRKPFLSTFFHIFFCKVSWYSGNTNLLYLAKIVSFWLKNTNLSKPKIDHVTIYDFTKLFSRFLLC